MRCFKIIANNVEFRVMWRPVCLICGVAQERGTWKQLCFSALRPKQSIENFPQHQHVFSPYWHNMLLPSLQVNSAWTWPGLHLTPEPARIWKPHHLKHRNMLCSMKQNHMFLHDVTENSLYLLCSTTAFALLSPLPLDAHHHYWECKLTRPWKYWLRSLMVP